MFGFNVDASNSTFLERICFSGSLLTRTCAANDPEVSPKTVRSPLSKTTFLVQISALGLIVILPLNDMTLNGFTFSILDARG